MGRVARFSTDDVAPRDRLAIWREVLVQSVLSVGVEPASADPFFAHATVHRLPGLRLLSGSSSSVTYQGTGQPMDDVVLSFGEPDHVFARQHGRETSIRRGDAFLLRCGARTQVRVPEGGQFMCLRLPRSSIQMNVADLDGAYCRPIPRDTPSLRLLKRYLGVFDDADEALAAPAVQHSAVTHIYDLLALVLGATRDAAHVAEGRGMRAARLKAIKDDVARHLREENLSVGTVAARHKVTPRYVQVLFDESGVTFTEYVIAQRLARAHRLVCDPQLSERTLTAIARDVGFGDLSYFNRAFRRRYGVAPSDLRMQARNQ
jgi:AraC-like DNA-binding protein